MKTIVAIQFVVFFSLSVVFSQKPIILSDDSISFGTGKYPGIIITIPEVNFEKTQKEWIKVLEKKTKSEVTKNVDELSIFGTNIDDFSANPVNVFSKFQNLDTMVRMLVVVELQKDKYLSKSTGENELIRGKNYLKKFAREQYVDFTADELKTEEKKLKNLTNELQSLKKDKSKLQDEIQSCNKDITNEKNNITIKNNELITVTNEIVNQNSQLNAMQEGAIKEQKKDYIKDLEKRKKKIMNDIESSGKKINKANEAILDADAAIPKNETRQGEYRLKIESQELAVKKVTEKLNVIKNY
jgi:predicted  nucleic acid-binding Zn-ribbon protein